MTKKEIINKIFQRLSANAGYEVYVPFLERRLRNGRWGLYAIWGLRAYCITIDDGCIVCRPWAGAECNWPARLDRLTKFELEYILKKCPEL
jgi:hypothetical protein